MKIKESTLNILEACTVRDNIVYLPPVTLDRQEYLAVNKILEELGGKWNRKVKGHLYDQDPSEMFDAVLLSGEIAIAKKEYQFFPTPADIAAQICQMADMHFELQVLEPSAGTGNIIKQLFRCFSMVHLTAVELNPKNIIELNKLKQIPEIESPACLKVQQDADYCSFNIIEGDFLITQLDPIFDRVIMNPPFSKQQDIDHITKAFSLLKPEGILVSIVSESVFYRSNRKTLEFREKILNSENTKEVIDLESGAFSESGTNVKTRIIKLQK